LSLIRRYKKIKKTLIYVSVLSGLCFFASCKKDDDNIDNPEPLPAAELTVEQSRNEVLRLSTSLEEDVQNLIDAEGIDQLEYISDLVNSETSSTLSRGTAAETRKDKAVRIARGMTSNLKSAFSRRSGRFISEVADENDTFVFEDFVGNWVWNEEAEDAEFISESDVISITFNSDEDDTELSGQLIIRSLELVQDAENNDLPVAIDIELRIDGEELISFDFDAIYNENDEPTSISTGAFIQPLRMDFDYTLANNVATGNTSYSFNNELVYSLNGTVVFTDNTLEEPSNIAGEIIYDGVRIEGNLDVAALNDFEGDDEIDAINDALICDFFTNDANQLIGSVTVQEDPATVGNPEACDPLPFIVYSDGSQENLLDLVDGAVTNLEDFVDTQLDELEEL